MGQVKNILFIMCDQLRADYLACYGHPHIKTPHIDQLAKKAVQFNHAYVQSPICGPSRMSFYTGRYMMSHGSIYNGVPLSMGIHNIGDYLRPEGLSVALVGKTHMAADQAGLDRAEVASNSTVREWISQCGFDPIERDDGLHPDQLVNPNLAYNQYLNRLGYKGKNPWHDYANSAEGDNGEILSGWHLRNSAFPARIQEEHSETPYMTNKATDYITQMEDKPWCLHLSYIKPHWPYMAPKPYHNMYTVEDMLPLNEGKEEAQNPHPVYQAFRKEEVCVTFQQEQTRKTVIPTYMGLITQIDDQLGKLFQFLQEQGRMEDTLIVFTSDHGDYLGDHGLGEKQLFHEESVRIPLIIYDPSSQADTTRGSTVDHLVESIDLIPTFIESVGGVIAQERLEGHSLLPLLHQPTVEDWREFAFSENDYSFYVARQRLNLTPSEARSYMIRSKDWKYMYYEKFPAQLFDLNNDPQERIDLGQDPAYQSICDKMKEELFRKFRFRKYVETVSPSAIEKRTGTAKKRGIYIGVW